MSYIGNTSTTQAFTPAVDFFNGNGSTTAFTLSRPVASVAQVQAVISNVPQKPGDAFTVSGNTITFTSAPPSGTQNIYVYYTSPITQVIAPGQGTVGTAQIQEGAVITADIANGAVTTAKLSSTTGTGAVALASLPSFTTTIGVGGATASASGSGVSFPATQSASSDANTLDDYEEGSWTPTIFGGTTAGTGTYSIQTGFYTKIGRQVTVTAFIAWSAHTGSGSMQVGGFPFSVMSSGQSPLCLSEVGNITLSANNIATMQIQGGTAALFLQTPVGGGLDSTVSLDNSGYFRFSGSYFV
jgi:hypothetical protein